jgi:hypothetical protein
VSDQQPQTQQPDDGDATPIGETLPHNKSPKGLPLPLWELHSVESWAKALLADVVDQSSRPNQPNPGTPEEPVSVPAGHHVEDVSITVVKLEDGHVGAGATIKHAAPGGRITYVHHLVKLDIVGTPGPGDPGFPPGFGEGSGQTGSGQTGV